jgi:hypothetical protein
LFVADIALLSFGLDLPTLRLPQIRHPSQIV